MSKIGIAPPGPARPIAIIGMSCRLPGANSIEEFWELLLREENQVCDVPAERFDVGTWHHPQPRTPGRMTSRRGSFIDDIAGFDADYFDISAHEAVRMHPQQRVLLETAHDAIEDAGIPLDQLAGTSTGVYVASLSTSEYWDLLREAGMLDLHAFLGTGPIGTLAGRLAHALDLRGPNLAVDATCASGLLAVHLACQSLRAGDAEFALAAGVSLVLTPDISIALSQSGVLSPTGISRFGEATSDGYGRGEGVAAVLLKPLDQALTDGDPVRAVILGSAMTSNGRAKAHMAAPCGDGQSEALRRAYLAAGIAPGDVDYVEAHGTGTVAGDRVELSALARVLGQGRRAGQPCVVGSVKSNVGHTEPTAGLVGLLKTALSLQHGWIPRTLHVDTPNPVLDTAGSVLRLARTAQPWPRRAHHPGLAGVSCLGATGSNTHAVLSTPPAPRTGDNRCTGPLTLPLSARKPEALTELARRYLRLLEDEQHTGRLRDVCYTAGAHRTHHELRSVIVGEDRPSLLDGLRSLAAGYPSPAVVTGLTAGPAALVVWSFTDHTTRAAQALPPGMSQEPRTANPLFAATLQRCETALRHAPSHPAAIARQPWAVSWAVQVAVASVLRDWGIEPDLLQGHGTGRLAAATVAGALSIEEAAALVADHDGTWLPSYVAARRQVWQDGEPPVVRIEIDADRLGSAGLYRAVAEAYVAGRHPRWDRVQRGGRYTWIPTYPWQRQRYWVDCAVSPSRGVSPTGRVSPTRPSGTQRAS